MNILYISKLDGRPWIGPTYSVPKQVGAQAIYDNVLWYNLCLKGVDAGGENLNTWRSLDYYADLLNYSTGKIKDLPEPFNKPDLIIVEQGYPFARSTVRGEILRSGIPYIVIPRGELTRLAQNKHKFKKLIGNWIFNYPAFMKNAIAIQCLTEQEKKETSDFWNKNKVVLPNGTDIPELNDEKKESLGIRCVSIGRIEPYQKGLDLLIDACKTIKDQLIKATVSITVYGSNMENKLETISHSVTEASLTDVITFKDAIFGEEKKKVLMNSDVFLMPSRFEGHPTGLLEALAYGLPCVVTTGSNMKKEIEEANAGWTADNNVETLRSALKAMIDDKDLFLEKGQNARNLAMEYDWIKIAKRSHEVYQKLLIG